ncbi:MAG: hypothetical protein WDW38_007330 [Sanguina aurantia]
MKAHYVLAHTPGRRLKAIDAVGVAEMESADPMDVSYLSLIVNDPQDHSDRQEASEEPPDAFAVLQHFRDARGELDVVIDLINNVEGRVMGTRQYERRSGSEAERITRVSRETMARVGLRQAALRGVAARLRKDAAALRAVVARDTTFYKDLRALQGFWKVHLNPGSVECPFSIDLALADEPHFAHSDAAAAAAAPDSSNTYISSSFSPLVPLMRDPSGDIRVQVEDAAAEPHTSSAQSGRSGGSDTCQSPPNPTADNASRPKQEETADRPWNLLGRERKGGAGGPEQPGTAAGQPQATAAPTSPSLPATIPDIIATPPPRSSS